MEEIRKIGVLYGGSSSEREISLLSGEGVHNAICELGYESHLIDFKEMNDLKELKDYDFISGDLLFIDKVVEDPSILNSLKK